MSSESKAEEVILFDLDSEQEDVRRAAVFAAAKSESLRVVQRLSELSGIDPSVEIRYLCRKALNAIASRAKVAGASLQVRKSARVTRALALEASDVVAANMESPDANLRASAYRAVAMKQDATLLAKVLARTRPEQEPDPELRSVVLQVVAVLGGKSQVAAISAFLDDPDARCRANAVEVLARLKDVGALAFVVRALQDQDHRVQTAAITALQGVGGLNLLKICWLMLRSDQYWARDAAAHCLCAVKSPQAVPILVDALADPYEAVRIKAKNGLALLAQRGIAAAAEALKQAESVKDVEEPDDFMRLESLKIPEPEEGIGSSDPKKRRRATQQLAALGIAGEEHVPLLLRQLEQETDPPAAANLIVALGNIRNPIILPLLEKRAVDPDQRIRAAVAEAYCSIGTAEALASAQAMLSDPHSAVVARAILGLRKSPAIDVMGPLRQLATHPEAGHRSMAVFVVSVLAEDRFLPLLTELTADADSGVRATAREALRSLEPAPTERAVDPERPVASTISGIFRVETPVDADVEEAVKRATASSAALRLPAAPPVTAQPPIAPADAEEAPDDQVVESFTSVWGERSASQSGPASGQLRISSSGLRPAPVTPMWKSRKWISATLVAAGAALVAFLVRPANPVVVQDLQPATTAKPGKKVNLPAGWDSAHSSTFSGSMVAAGRAALGAPGSALDMEARVLVCDGGTVLARAGQTTVALDGVDSRTVRVGDVIKSRVTVGETDKAGITHVTVGGRH
jgi:HEAT repeat protein